MMEVPMRFSMVLVLVVVMQGRLRGIDASTQSKLFRAWEHEANDECSSLQWSVGYDEWRDS